MCPLISCIGTLHFGHVTCTPASHRSPLLRATRVRDTKVDAEAIHQQNGLNPSVCVRKAAGAFVGQLGKLRAIVNRADAALAPDGGGSQPPRRLPACPTSRQRFHFYVVHPSNSSLRWTSTKRTPRSRASTPEIDARTFDLPTEPHARVRARPSARGCYHEIVTFLPRAAAGAGA